MDLLGGKSITYENNDSCKQKLVIVRKLHIEYDLSLKVFFFTITHSPFIINHPETVNCCNFLFVPPLWAILGENCLVSVLLDCNLENKRRKLRWDGV